LSARTRNSVRVAIANPMITVPRVPTGERRSKPRSIPEKRATTLIQAILKDPTHAASELEIDLKAGADASVTIAVLAAAETLAGLRGIDIGAQVDAVRGMLKKAGYLK
jgi:hypothetical protein